MAKGSMGSDSGDRYAVAAVKSGAVMPVGSPEKGGLNSNDIMKFYKKRTILPQEKLGAAADLKKSQKEMGFAQDDFRLDPEEVAFLRTLKEEHANRRRWRFWHKACLVIWVEMLFILIGGGIFIEWFNIAPHDSGGIQTGGPMIGAGLLVSSHDEDQHALVHSGHGKSTVEVRAAEGAFAALVLSGEDHPGMRTERFSLSSSDSGHFTLAQAAQSRMEIVPVGALGGDVDIQLDPGLVGEVTVHGDVSIGMAHVRTRASNLTLQAANGSDVRVVTAGNGSLRIFSQLTQASGGMSVGGDATVAGDTHVISSLRVGANTHVEGRALCAITRLVADSAL
jgi:hypothetical protein